jgi:hypothetical protein
VPKVRRPCPRGLYNGCPIPRELCTEDHEATGKWHCLKFLNDLDFFLFGRLEEDEDHDFVKESEDVVSLEDLMRVLGEEEDV